MSINQKMTAIADEIRYATGKSVPTYLRNVYGAAVTQSEVLDAGYKINAVSGSTPAGSCIYENCYYLYDSTSVSPFNQSGVLGETQQTMQTESFAQLLGSAYLYNPDGYPSLRSVSYEFETPTEVFEISTLADLQTFRDRVYAGEYSLNAVLLADIDTRGSVWTPIGTPDYENPSGSFYYGGVFDGKGHTISNLVYSFNNVEGNFGDGVEDARRAFQVGLFGETRGAVIANVVVAGRCGTSGRLSYNSKIGGVVACANSTLIYNCVNRITFGASVSAEYGYHSNVGGIVGVAKASRIIGCSNHGDITSACFCDVGGLVGLVKADSVPTILESSYNDAAISGYLRVGGLVGSLDACTTLATPNIIENCYSTGEVGCRVRYLTGGTFTDVPRSGGAGLVGSFSKIEVATKLSLDDMAAEIPNVYQGGRASVLDAFWDTYQDDGVRMDYNFGFTGVGWTDELFQPKYDIVFSSSGAVNAFRRSRITNLKQRLADCSVKLDFLRASTLYGMFYGAAVTHLPEIGGAKVTVAGDTFNNCSELVSIDRVSVAPNITCNCSGIFTYCEKLVSVDFSSGFKPSGLSFMYAKNVSASSLHNLAVALADVSEESGTHSIVFGSSNIGKLSEEDIVLLESKGWSYS